MNKLIVAFILFFVAALSSSFADQDQQVITLKDGSQIRGELSGINNGIYTVKTPIIGDVHVAVGDVASITNGNAPAAAAASTGTSPTGLPAGIAPNIDSQMASAQQKLMSNPQSMAILQEMAQDPVIAQALQDPALVQAVTSHDYQAIQNNPRVQELLKNPKMQAFIKAIAAQQGTPIQ